MSRFCIVMIFLCAVLLSPAGSSGMMADHISQWGITWHFDRSYDYGQFANGDYWVLGPVLITRITPDFDGLNNGWEVNPQVIGGHGFQAGCKNDGFDPNLVPDLPYRSPNNQIVSIVKTIASDAPQPCIKTAAVLTVVPTIPPGKGSAVFRPPYVGSDKPYFEVKNLRTDLLPSFEPAGIPPGLDYIEMRFRKLRLDHKPTSYNRSLRPQDSMRDYQPKNSRDIINSAIRLMLNDPLDIKIPALIQYVQAGIDKLFSILQGQTWFPADGHEPTHALQSAFSAILLDFHQAKDFLKKASFFHASKCLFSSTFNGYHLWGVPSTDKAYWKYIMGFGGSRSNRDPYSYIDGGECGAAYQLIVSQSYKGEALAIHLMPILKDAWSDNDLVYTLNYADRWVNHGVIAQPDPCAPFDGIIENYGITYGPDPKNPRQCILDPDLSFYNGPNDFQCKEGKLCGRYPLNHGKHKDAGQYKSDFVEAMWNAYRHTVR